MRVMTATLSWGIGALLIAGLAMGGDAKEDQSKLEGTWVKEMDGKKFEFKLTKGKFSITFDENENKATFKGTIKIDPKKKPKEMDLTVTEGEKFKGETARAIYELKGDTLRWCANEPGKEERPAAFPDSEGGMGGHLYFVLKRAK